MRDASLQPAPPEHVASLYAFLASDMSAPISGEIFWGAGPYAGRFPKPEMTFEMIGDPDSAPAGLDQLASAFGTV